MYIFSFIYIYNKCYLVFIFLMVCFGKKKNKIGGSFSVDSDGGDGVSLGSFVFVVFLDVV